MSIKVEAVTKMYGEQAALDEVSFEVRKGEIVGFLGPNGAGKSTMMKIITGFIPASKGVTKVNSLNVADEPLTVKGAIGYLPEHNPLYTDMYVREYLHFVGGIHKVKQLKKKVDEIIQTVGLEVEQNKKIEALSKGFRQRVGLAQALLHDPAVLILDEPTTGLDPNQLAEIRGLIKKVGKEKTVMLSTHIMQEVEAICDRVIIINKGKIVADEKTTDIQHLFGEQNTIVVEFDKSVKSKDLKLIPGVISVVQLGEQHWRIEGEKGAEIRNSLLQFAVDHDLSVLTLQKESKRLEDIFKALTKGNTDKA